MFAACNRRSSLVLFMHVVSVRGRLREIRRAVSSRGKRLLISFTREISWRAKTDVSKPPYEVRRSLIRVEGKIEFPVAVC